MKIEIDLDDVFRDGDGNPEESLEQSIRRQVIDRLSGDMKKRMFDKIDAEMARIMNEQIAKLMTEKMPELLDDIMNVTYTPVSTFGQRGEPTTFRTEIVNSVAKNLVYQPKQYSSDENAFTKAVKSVVEQKTKAIQESIIKHVDEQFKQDAINFAVARLSERLGIKK